MLIAAVFAGIGLIWLGSGVALFSAPTWWMSVMTKALLEPAYRFAVAQLMILTGLLLVAGTSWYETSRAWMVLGVIAVSKGMFFLGAPAHLRTRVIAWWRKAPIWAQRGAGLLMVVLAALLTIDMVRAGS